jgi:cytidylate kinase
VALTEAQPVVLITGISASGKSTVGELLSRRFVLGVHVKGDVFRRMVTSGGQEMTASPSEEAARQLRLRYRLGARTADAYHDAGFSVVVQDIVLGAYLSEYAEAIHSRPLVVVVLTPSTEVVAERESGRRKSAYRDGFNTIEELDHALRVDTPHLGLWLDSSDQHPEETVDAIVRRGLTEGLIT